MFKWFATLAMVTAALALEQDAKQTPSAQVDQQRASTVIQFEVATISPIRPPMARDLSDTVLPV
jgi:hypothetical protein